jgi:hypothetical protein
MATTGEAFGYYGRAWSHNNIRNGSPYLLQMMLILASAPLLAASIYMTLGRFTRALEAEDYAILGTRWITKIYVLIDIGSFVCQIMGSAMQANGDDAGRQMGSKLVIGGLSVQLVAFAVFILMAVVLHRRLNSEPTIISKNPLVPWRRHMWTLYIVSMLVMVRSAFRLIEFAEGNEGALMKHEAYLYIFDASLMFLVTLALALVHPGRLLKTIRTLSVRSSFEGANFALIEEQRTLV